MRLTRQHTARGWRVTWAESKKQPFTPWVPDPDRDHPPRKTHRGSRGKQRRPRDPDDQVDLTGTSGSEGEPDSKYQRRYSPRRSDRSPSRRRSPGHRRDSPPQLQLCRKGLPPTSFILPEHHHVVLPQSLHSRVSITATGLTRASVLAIAATYHHRHLRKWARGLPRALPAAVDRKLTQHSTAAGSCPDPPLAGHMSPRPDVMTLNVQMSLRPKLRALDVLVRECQYPLTLHVQEAGPLIIQRVHPLHL